MLHSPALIGQSVPYDSLKTVYTRSQHIHVCECPPATLRRSENEARFSIRKRSPQASARESSKHGAPDTLDNRHRAVSSRSRPAVEQPARTTATSEAPVQGAGPRDANARAARHAHRTEEICRNLQGMHLVAKPSITNATRAGHGRANDAAPSRPHQQRRLGAQGNMYSVPI